MSLVEPCEDLLPWCSSEATPMHSNSSFGYITSNLPLSSPDRSKSNLSDGSRSWIFLHRYFAFLIWIFDALSMACNLPSSQRASAPDSNSDYYVATYIIAFVLKKL